ncbi:hypothetical protein [Nocardioides sp.]|jgi:hypothetical protein|uniref:hypothetical protein n=1 Tax=Nocardioides sp. TaxID=35761 RepID=UPI002F3E5FB7
MHVSRPRRSAIRARALLATSLVAALAVLASATAPTAHTAPTGETLASASFPVERGQHHQGKVRKVKVDPRLFGVHDRFLTSLSHRSTRSIRLWDAGTDWPAIQPTRTTWNWAPLDTVVRKAHRNGTSVTLVVGLSPSYAAARSTDAPDLGLYRAYLTAVMKRYRAQHWGYRGIAAYQVWNEANISTFWTGTNVQLARLTKAAYDVRNKVDRGAQIIAPAMVTRLKFEQKVISAFYATRVPSTHRPVWKYVDAISLNLYPTGTIPLAHGRTRTSTPEDSMVLLRTVRGLLAKRHVPSSIPIWNTEVNYGMGSGTPAAPIPQARQVAYVMRTYLLNAARGVKRVDWYAYDMGVMPGGGTLGNTLLTDPTERTAGRLTPAGVAFTRIQGWMRGTLIGTAVKPPCSTDRHGTYTCKITYAHGVGRVYWNPFRRATVRLPHSARTKVSEFGASSKARGGARLTVTYRPVLVKSKR